MVRSPSATTGTVGSNRRIFSCCAQRQPLLEHAVHQKWHAGQEAEKEMKANGTWAENVPATLGLQVREKGDQRREAIVVEDPYDLFVVRYAEGHSDDNVHSIIDEFETLEGKKLISLWESTTTTDAPIPLETLYADMGHEDVRPAYQAACDGWNEKIQSYYQYDSDDDPWHDHDPEADWEGDDSWDRGLDDEAESTEGDEGEPVDVHWTIDGADEASAETAAEA